MPLNVRRPLFFASAKTVWGPLEPSFVAFRLIAVSGDKVRADWPSLFKIGERKFEKSHDLASGQFSGLEPR